MCATYILVWSEMTVWSWFFLSTFVWAPGIELRSPGLHRKRLQPSSVALWSDCFKMFTWPEGTRKQENKEQMSGIRAGCVTTDLHTWAPLTASRIHGVNSSHGRQRISDCKSRNQLYCVSKSALESFNPQYPGSVWVRYPFLTFSSSKTALAPSNN